MPDQGKTAAAGGRTAAASEARAQEQAAAANAAAFPDVDPDNIPAEVSAGVRPDAGGNRLLAAAQKMAPSLTAEFVDAYRLSDEDLAAIARGEVPPPPTVGPVHNVDLHRTPGGWQLTPVGVAPADAGKNAISR